MTEQKTIRQPRGAKEKETTVETVQEVVQEVVEAKTVKEVRVIKDTDKIPVMNNTTGRYAYRSKSGYAFDLEEYGDIANIPFSELRAMLNGQKRHITDAFIIILDEDVVAELNYTKEYKHILTTEQITELLRNPDSMKEVLPLMPHSMKEVVITIAKQKYQDGSMMDLRVVNVIKEALQVNIME